MSRRELKTQLVVDLSGASAEDLELFRSETRRAAAWNRRATLLRAHDAGANAEVTAFIDQSVAAIEAAFQNSSWMQFGDATSGLQPLTPLPTAQEVARLAQANSRAAQTVATIALAGDLLEVSTTFLNIANGRIPASVAEASADVASTMVVEPSAATASPSATASRRLQGRNVLLAAGLLAGAAAVVAVVALNRR